jgi:hypothetical protein
MEMMESLMDLTDEEFTVEMLLKINPTDIILDANGNYTIKEDAKKLAKALVDAETAKEKEASLKTAEKAATAKTITREDYKTLQDSGLF